MSVIGVHILALWIAVIAMTFAVIKLQDAHNAGAHQSARVTYEAHEARLDAEMDRLGFPDTG